MGFWSKLNQMLGDGPQGSNCIHNGLPPPTRPAPPMPTIKQPKKDSAKNISEPVLSLVETIRNDEWELNQDWSIPSGIYTRGARGYVATHVWLGKTVSFMDTKAYDDNYCPVNQKFVCTASWMNEYEKEFVASEMWHASELHHKLRKEREAIRARETFMVFTKQDYNKGNV